MKNKTLLFLFVGFFLIFAGFDSAQYYLSSIFYAENIKIISLISLFLIYGVFSLTTLFSPYICKKLGIKLSLFLAGICYSLFIFSLIAKSPTIVYIFSAILGIAAGVIWTSQGIYLIQKTNEKNRGLYSGLFFSLLPVGPTIFTYLMSFFIDTASFKIIYFVLAIISLVGAILLLFLKEEKNQIQSEELSVVKTLRNKDILKIIPFIFGSSFIFGLILSVLPIRITDLFGLGYVGKLISIFSLSGIVISFLTGKLIDKIGHKKIIFPTIISGLIGLMVILFFKSLIAYYIGTLLLVINYSSSLVLAYPVLSSFFKGEIKSAVAIRWMMFGLAVATSALLAIFLPFTTMILIDIVILFIALLSTASLYRKKT